MTIDETIEMIYKYIDDEVEKVLNDDDCPNFIDEIENDPDYMKDWINDFYEKIGLLFDGEDIWEDKMDYTKVDIETMIEYCRKDMEVDDDFYMEIFGVDREDLTQILALRGFIVSHTEEKWDKIKDYIILKLQPVEMK